MRRSSSMDQAISILDKETSSIAIFRPAEDEDYNPLPLPRTPEPRLLSSTGTHSRSTTDSYYSLFSPSEVSVSFRFLNDNSPGIDLIYSSSDLDASGNEEDRPDAKMATVDMRTEPLTNNSPFYTQNGSLESLDGVGTSSSDDLAGRNGGIPLIRASQPSIHFSYGEEEERQLGDSQRSKSLDSLSQMPKNENDSQYHSLDMRRGSNSSNHNNNNIEKLQNYSVLEQLAAEMRQQSRAEDSPLDTTPESEAADTSDLYLTPSPGSTNEYKDSRLLELPAISEENEEASRSRRSSMTHDAALPSDFNHHSIPEPEHIAPGHPRTNSESSQTYHRRVVSDNVVPYNHKPDADFIPSLENPPFPVLIRDAPGRASQTGRCMSQCVLNSQESAPGPTTSERSLSRSDPSLEEKMETDGLDELDEAPKIQAPAPPPVYLTRKNSVVKPNSWQGYMHHGAAIPHSVVTPATAGLLQYSSTRAKVGSSETVNLVESADVGLLRSSSSSSSVVAFVRRSIRRLSARGDRPASQQSLPPSPEFVEIVVELAQEAGTLKRRNTTPNRSKRQSKTALRGRGVEKPVKKNSSDSLLGTFFGKRNKSRPKLDSSTFNNGEPSTSNGSQTLPTKGTTHSRPGIPSFSDRLNYAADVFYGSVTMQRVVKVPPSPEVRRKSLPEIKRNLSNGLLKLLNIGREEREDPIQLEQAEEFEESEKKNKRSQSAVSASIEIHITETVKQHWRSEGSLIGPTIIGIADEAGSYSSYGSQDTIVESYNVNSLDSRCLTIGLNDTILESVEEVPETRRASTQETTYGDHRRERSDDLLQHRRVSESYINQKTMNHKRSNSVFPSSFDKIIKIIPKFGSQGEMSEQTIAADGLPDKFQTLVSPLIPPTQEEEDHVPVDVISALFERYAKYDLFSHHTSKESSHDSWHEKFRHDKMNSKAVKKQDAIYELIDLEKKHCANLAFLQHGYRSRLIEEGILPLADVNKLIPDVIEALLEFHLHLLVRLQARQNESNEVETISDILNQEFAETGMNTIKCIDAYTTFGSMKDRAEKNWVVMLTKNIRFSEFYKKAMANKIYRDFEFRTVMTRIIARPARYGLHCDSILKNENNKFSESFLLTEKAIETTRRFTSRIDNNLLIQHMNKKFDEIRKSFEKDSSTHLFISDKSVQDGYVKIEWNMESICHHMNQEGGRRLFCIGDANVKSHTANKMIPVTIVCFDDIIVFLQKIQGNKERYRFAPIDQPVLSLHALLLRNLAGHSLNIMLIPAVKPALVDIEFTGKNDFNKWMTILEKAIQHAPTKVRLNKKESDDYLRQATVEHEKLERKQKEAEEQWMKQLIDMFERYGIEEVAMFSGFVGKRNDFSLALSTHLDQMPLRGRPDLVERVKDSVRTKFKELRSMKTVPMKKLIDDMTQAKETILWSYLQELEETRDMDSDGSGSDSSGSGRSRPRRIKTFHGATVESTSKPSGIRRHTTVPRMGIKEDEEESDDSKREREHAEEKNHSLPLTQSLSSHRECRRLIRDLEKLKTENISLKNELALDKLRITSLEKMRSTSSTVLSDSVETLEILRKKEKDVREDEARRKKNLEEFENDVMEKQQKLESERTQFLLEKEKHKQELKRREEEIANKWTALQGATEAPGLLSRSREPIYMAKSPSHISRESTAMQFPDKLISKTEVKKKK